MTLDAFLPHLDMSEPILVKWALSRIEDMRPTDPAAAADWEGRLFDNDTVGRLIETTESPMEMSRLLRVLSTERFSGHVAALTAKWPDLKEGTANVAARMIAEIDPAAAEALFREAIAAETPLQDLLRWRGIREAIAYLPASAAAAVAAAALDRWRNHPDDTAAFFEPTATAFDLAWRCGDPGAAAILRRILLMPVDRTEEFTDEHLKPVVLALGISESEYDMVLDVVAGYDAALPSEMAPFYRDDMDLTLLDDAIRRLADGEVEAAAALMENHGRLLADERLRGLFQELFDDAELKGQLTTAGGLPYLHGLFVAALSGGLRQATLDLSGMTADAVADLLATDTRVVPDPDAFVAFFQAAGQDDAVRSLVKVFHAAREHFGGVHVVHAMAALGYDAFLEAVLSPPPDDSEPVEQFYSAVENLLVRFGDRAMDFCRERYDQLKDDTRISALLAASRIATPAARRFLEAHLDDLWRIEKEFALSAGMAVASEAVLEKVRNIAGKGQHMMDEAFIVISLLKGDRAAASPALLETYYREEELLQARIEAVLRGDFDAPALGFLDLELVCAACGREGLYRLTRVVLGAEGEALAAGDITCIHCGAASDFEMTLPAKTVIAAELTRMNDLDKADFIDALRRSPIDISGRDYLGQGRDIVRGMRDFQEKVRRHPADPANHLGLGFICHFLERHARAKAYLENAIRRDPDYLQAYYLLADMAESEAGPVAALDQLARGLPHLKTWKYAPLGRGTRQTFMEEYCSYYNDMLTEAARPGRRLSSRDFGTGAKKKIGRNDPCPCGSGKKYKKCCGR